jgi:hypothetical protein
MSPKSAERFWDNDMHKDNSHNPDQRKSELLGEKKCH